MTKEELKQQDIDKKTDDIWKQMIEEIENLPNVRFRHYDYSDGRIVAVDFDKTYGITANEIDDYVLKTKEKMDELELSDTSKYAILAFLSDTYYWEE